MENIITCPHCGSINDYRIEESGPHLKAVCKQCNSYIKFIQQNKPFILPFGRFKGRELNSLITQDEIKYLDWVLKGDFSKNLKERIQAHLKSLTHGTN